MINNTLKKFAITGTTFMLVLGTTLPTYASTITNIENTTSIERSTQYPTFEDYMKNDVKKKDVKAEDLTQLKGIYNKSIKYNDEGKLKEASAIMKDFYQIANKYADLYKSTYVKPKQMQVINVKHPTFEDYMKNDVKKKDIKAEDLTQLKGIYNKSIKYNDEGKLKEASTVMKDFYQIANKYEDLYKSNYIRISNVQYPTFEEFMKADVKQDNIELSKMKVLEDLYNEAVNYKKEGKFKEANKTITNLFHVVTSSINN